VGAPHLETGALTPGRQQGQEEPAAQRRGVDRAAKHLETGAGTRRGTKSLRPCSICARRTSRGQAGRGSLCAAKAEAEEGFHPVASPARRHLAAVAAALLLLLLIGGRSRAQDVAQNGSSVGAPVRHRVGLHVTDLHSFDLLRGTFGASFWVWSVGPAAARVLETMEFANADQVVVRLESTVPRGTVAWSQRKITGTFREQWNLRNFPFDRNSLEIHLEEGVEEEDRFAYDADVANSGYNPRDVIEGWRVRGMRVEVGVVAYATNFGDPAAAGPASRFSQLRAVLELERSNYTGFLKLTAALYAGFLVCAIGCLVPITATTFAPRITLLVASLFALVINMRTASLALGSEHGATLIDKLHFVGLAYVVAITAITVLVRIRTEGGDADHVGRLVRLDHRCCLAAACLFVLLHACLLLQAAVEG
jgi:hypothetical protein